MNDSQKEVLLEALKAIQHEFPRWVRWAIFFPYAGPIQYATSPNPHYRLIVYDRIRLDPDHGLCRDEYHVKTWPVSESLPTLFFTIPKSGIVNPQIRNFPLTLRIFSPLQQMGWTTRVVRDLFEVRSRKDYYLAEKEE